MKNLLVILFLLLSTNINGKELPFSTYLSEAPIEEQHQCLSLIIFLEARGESELGRKLVGRTVLNRVKSSSYPNDVCSVIAQKSQFEPVKKEVHEVIFKIENGDLFAGLDFIDKFPNRERNLYLEVEKLSYLLLKKMGWEYWEETTHFVSISSLKERNLPIPEWVGKMNHVVEEGKHTFMRYHY